MSKRKYDLDDILNQEYSLVVKAKNDKADNDKIPAMQDAFNEIREEMRIYENIIDSSLKHAYTDEDTTYEYDEEILDACRRELDNDELSVDQKVSLINQMSEVVKGRRNKERQRAEYNTEIIKAFKEVTIAGINQIGRIYPSSKLF